MALSPQGRLNDAQLSAHRHPEIHHFSPAKASVLLMILGNRSQQRGDLRWSTANPFQIQSDDLLEMFTWGANTRVSLSVNTKQLPSKSNFLDSKLFLPSVLPHVPHMYVYIFKNPNWKTLRHNLNLNHVMLDSLPFSL